MSRLFSPTLREAPVEAEVASHRLLMRAGFIRPLVAGVFTALPLGRRTIDHIERILRQEIDALGGQEMTMPVVHPADLWKETGRWHKIGPELGRFQDRSGRDMVLAMTHEEVIADLARREIHSYRQLPLLVYHIQTKWRDDPRPLAGLIRVREFTMLDSYSLDSSREGLEAQYRAHYQAYFKIFSRCGLPVVAVRADVGMMGGVLSHEFMYLTPIGEDTLLICDACGSMANRRVARFRKTGTPAEAALPLEKVSTPGTTTIEALARFLDVPVSRTAKAVFLMASVGEGGESHDRLVFVVIRGDLEVNETKVANALKARQLRPAREEEIRAAGAVPGYASPVGLSDALVLVDDSIPGAANLLAGANEENYHLRNVNYGRDFQAQIVADIATARAGDACAECGAPLRAERGVEVGNILQLGTFYTEAMGCTFQDRDGVERPIWMGSYGIEVGRLLACLAEHHHDEAGLVLPVTVAPYPVHIVALAGGEEEAERLYASLYKAGIEALYDDRAESPGVKFADADLIGLPLRLTVSRRSLERGGVELKPRRGEGSETLPLEDIPRIVREALGAREEETQRSLGPVPYRV
ncbi:MAG: proline--tRNA ligase [Chloroflexota bacterium]